MKRSILIFLFTLTLSAQSYPPALARASYPAVSLIGFGGNTASADNGPAFQAAIDSMPNGGHIVVPGRADGVLTTYNISTAVVDSTANAGVFRSLEIECGGGSGTVKLVWTGSAAAKMFTFGPSNSAIQSRPVYFHNCALDSQDESTHLAGMFIYIRGNSGSAFDISNNVFWSSTNAIGGYNFYVSRITNNQFRKSLGDCIYFEGGGKGPVNGVGFYDNEFFYCAGYHINNRSNNLGGSNGNHYRGNDFEGTIPASSPGTLYLTDSYSDIVGNRFEDTGTLSADWRSVTLEGNQNSIDQPSGFGEYSATPAYQIEILSGAQGNKIRAFFNVNPAVKAIHMAGNNGGTTVWQTILDPSLITETTSNDLLLTDGRNHDFITWSDSFGVRSANPSSPYWSGQGQAGMFMNAQQFFSAPIAEGISPRRPVVDDAHPVPAGTIVYNEYNRYNASKATDQAFAFVCSNGASGTCGDTTGTWQIVPSFTRWQGSGTAAPATGAHRKGDIVWNEDPSGGTLGWICYADGTPGTWHTMAVP